MAKVIRLKKANTTRVTATLLEKAAASAMHEHLPLKASLLLLAILGLRDSVPESKFLAVETLAYEVECLIVDGKLPWDGAGRCI